MSTTYTTEANNALEYAMTIMLDALRGHCAEWGEKFQPDIKTCTMRFTIANIPVTIEGLPHNEDTPADAKNARITLGHNEVTFTTTGDEHRDRRLAGAIAATIHIL